MKHAIALAAAAAALALSLASPPTPAQPGIGYGQGMGMMGPGYGMMGPGAYGPGMGMGPGTMGGPGLPSNLGAEQRAKISEIQRELRKRQWPLMQEMHELMWNEAEQGGALDEQAQRRDFERHAALQKQMFESMLDARKRMEAVLTPQQREELRRGPRPPAR